MSDEELKINLNVADIKKGFNNAIEWFKKDWVVKASIAVILLALVIIGVWIRTQNLSLLHDSTTGKFIPLALDPFYWLRMAQTIIQQGSLPAVDPMRIIAGGFGYSNELLPHVIVFLYRIIHAFNPSATLQFVDVIYPVIAFVLGILAFFFLVQKLTKSKTTALISSAFLMIIPTYLYRTMSGFSDHDALGTFAFFATLLLYVYALNWINKKREHETKKQKKMELIYSTLWGLGIAILSVFTLLSWGGIFNFIPMIVPLSFLLLWILNSKDIESWKKNSLKFIIFYLTIQVATVLLSTLWGFTIPEMISRIVTDGSSLLAGITLLFCVSDFLIIRYSDHIPIKNIKKNHILWSIALTIFLGFIFLLVKGGMGAYFSNIVNKLLHPFGTSRVGLTVAENQQPYIDTWISQTGPIFFWLFFAGLVTIGINIAKEGVKGKKKITFVVLWTLLMAGLLLSRISSTSILNGTNFLSKLFYFGSILIFGIYLIRLYLKDEIKASPNMLILFSMMFFMLIAARGAQRLIFTVTPFACLAVGYLIFSLAGYYKRSKDELFKMIMLLALLGVLIASIFSFNNLAAQSVLQAKNTGPSATTQWQQAMAWVRNNTATNAIFAHWWDYGYWVEYLGERATIADGGHFEGDFRDHLIGRYVLTEPDPNLTLSFLKSNNVTNLLIDPSDLGKYSAYSIIGSDAAGTDRYSYVPIMPVSANQTQVQGNNTIRVYQNAFQTDADIVYNYSGQQLFIPMGQAYVIGVLLNTTGGSGNESLQFEQPKEVLYYNGQQLTMPMRYLYVDGKLVDFGNGYNSAAYVLPSLSQSGSSLQINSLGTVVYLSPKVFNSLFAQLYLMGDPTNKYPTITLAHAQYDTVLQVLKSQGYKGDFVYFGGFDGPIKIWNVTYPNYILSKEEFTRTSGTYAEFDNLTVTN